MLSVRPRRSVLAAVILLAASAPGVAHGQAAGPTEAEYRSRRAALLDSLPDGVVLVPGAPEPARDYETFIQSPSFFYLTGLREPDAALVMVKRGADRRVMVFVPQRDPASEVWSGVRLGTAGVTAQTGMPAREAPDLLPVLDSLLAGGATLHVTGELGSLDVQLQDEEWEPRSRDEQLVSRLRSRMPSGADVQDMLDVLLRMRSVKSAAELELIRTAAEITSRAQREAMMAAAPRMHEYELQALVEYVFRRSGADRPSFATIVGSGPNATTLHYNANDRRIEPGDMIVMDIGASYAGYAADITRTVPANGVFTPEQRAIYQLVRDGQAAAERQAVAGAEGRLMNDSASAVMARGLARLGLVDSATATYDCGAGERPRQCPQLSLYYLHGLSHGIGLEVHDPEQYFFTGRIAPGSAFTIEPGLYVRHDVFAHLPDTPRNRAMAARLAPVVMRYQGIGVRIEDDYIVTDRGTERISLVPREVGEIEEMMRTRTK